MSNLCKFKIFVDNVSDAIIKLNDEVVDTVEVPSGTVVKWVVSKSGYNTDLGEIKLSSSYNVTLHLSNKGSRSINTYTKIYMDESGKYVSEQIPQVPAVKGLPSTEGQDGKVLAVTEGGYINWVDTSGPVSDLSEKVKKNTNDIASLNSSVDSLNVETSNLQDIKADKATTLRGYGIKDSYTKEEIDAKIYAFMEYKGQVERVEDLPEIASVGDVYNVISTEGNYCWNGEEWDKLSETIDLSHLATKQELADEAEERESADALKVNITDFDSAMLLKADQSSLQDEIDARLASESTKVSHEELESLLELKADKENLINEDGGITNIVERETTPEKKNVSRITNNNRGNELSWSGESSNVIAAVRTKECASNSIGTQMSVTYAKSDSGSQGGYGSRLSMSISGAYYTKGKINDNLEEGDELVVKSDLSTAMSGCYTKTEIDTMVTQLRDKDHDLTEDLSNEVSTRASEDARVLVEAKNYVDNTEIRVDDKIHTIVNEAAAAEKEEREESVDELTETVTDNVERLDERITTEIAARENADLVLQTNIDNINTSLRVNILDAEEYGINDLKTQKVISDPRAKQLIANVVNSYYTGNRVSCVKSGNKLYNVLEIINNVDDKNNKNNYYGFVLAGSDNTFEDISSNNRFYSEYVYLINFTEGEDNLTYLLYKNTKDIDFNTKLTAGAGIAISVEEGNKLKITNTESSTSIVELQQKVAALEETLPVESFEDKTVKEYVDERISSVSQDIQSLDNAKQDVLSSVNAGDNIVIAEDAQSGKVKISVTGMPEGAVWGGITGTLDNQEDLKQQLDSKQNSLSAENAGTGISIYTDKESGNLIIANTQTSAEWGKITGKISDQSDVVQLVDTKVDASYVSDKIEEATGYTDSKYKGQVETLSDLPEEPVNGDIVKVLENGNHYIYNETLKNWVVLSLSVDLSDYYTKSESDSKYALSNTLSSNYYMKNEVNSKIDQSAGTVTSNLSGLINSEASRASEAEEDLDTRVTALENSGAGGYEGGQGIEVSGKVISAVQATDSVLGVTKLFNSTGNSDKGAVTQSFFTTKLSDVNKDIHDLDEAKADLSYVNSNVNTLNNSITSVSNAKQDKLTAANAGRNITIEEDSQTGVLKINSIGGSGWSIDAYTKLESDARFATKTSEHEHENMSLLNDLSVSSDGTLLFRDKPCGTVATKVYNNVFTGSESEETEVIDTSTIVEELGLIAIYNQSVTIKNTSLTDQLTIRIEQEDVEVLNTVIEADTVQSYQLNHSKELHMFISGSYKLIFDMIGF